MAMLNRAQRLPFLPKHLRSSLMSTMNISLPEVLKSFVDEQVSQGAYGTSSEYVRELIRRDQDRLRLRRGLLLAGAPRHLRSRLILLTSKGYGIVCAGRPAFRSEAQARGAPRASQPGCR